MKKLLVLLLSLMLVASLTPLAAAGELEHMELTVTVWDVGRAFPEGKEKDAMLKLVEEKFNVTLVPMNVGWGDYNDKYMTWAAAGEMPDVAGGTAMVGGSTFYSWIEDGVVRALPDDLSAYPNLARYMDLPEVLAYQVDGQNYFFPRMTYNDPSYWCMDRGLVIRKDWLEALGLPMPTDGDMLLATMEAFTDKDPDGDGQKNTIGFAYNAVFPTSQQIASYGYTDSRWVKMEDGNWKWPVCEENTIPLIDMLRKAYKNGWMDQDFAARATNDCRELFAAGQIGILAYQNTPKHLNNIYKSWVLVQPDKKFEDCVALVPLTGDKACAFQEMSFWSETYMGGHVDDKKAERIMMLMDYLYSDESMKMATFGFEGEDYKVEDGQIVPTLPLNEAGDMISLSDKYPSAGLFATLAVWCGDMLQYENPAIPQYIRDMSQAEYERRVAEWKSPNLDWEVAALNLPEKTEMSIRTNTQWSAIIADGSDTPTEELYKTALAEWNAQGYEAAWKAVTEAAAKLGK
ncbi:MAG TPA: extracellular solute-binding protein [Clostridiales bacterium]|nr:extracellular solute-binding protein [Clostridiales bacterium]